MKILLMLMIAAWTGGIAFAKEVVPGYEISLPKDSGSHPQYRTEWWYLTGWVDDGAGIRRGFQITFFRSRNAGADGNPSQFAAKQILFAHAAIADAQRGRLIRDERTARAGFELAEAKESTVDVFIDNWSLQAHGDRYLASIVAREFSLDLQLAPTQPALLHGDKGYSRKGPAANAASYYFSLPHLEVSGSIVLEGKSRAVVGQAWFDHEWTNDYVDTQAVGWDWMGINLDDGGALMAFRMRDSQGKPIWSSGTWRINDRTTVYKPEEVVWRPLREWRSSRTGVSFPVAWAVTVGAREIELRPLMDDQENDARGSVGMLYWEGAVDALDANGQKLGRGYLELTGYGAPARF